MYQSYALHDTLYKFFSFFVTCLFFSYIFSIANNLSRHNKQSINLSLSLIQKKKKKLGYKYTWVSNGKIFARKTNGCSVVSVSTVNDLAMLV